MAEERQDKIVNKVSVKLPPFWPEEPEIWFSQVEAQFVTSGIASDSTKYYTVLQQLDQRMAKEVRDVIVNPPKENKYDLLKKELIKRVSTSYEQKLRQLLKHEEIGDRKPSQFLRHLRALAGSTITDELLRSIWSSRLPTHLQEIVTMQSNAELGEVAELVDKVAEVSCNSARQVASTSASSTNIDMQELATLIQDMVNQEVAKVERGRNRRRSRSDNYRSRSTSRRYNREGKYCY